jgi:CRISPR-associated endonuclease/helicase Cas3
MMVTFVSQCEKKALTKTRRVLDAFASRIGSRTWQTVITTEGLLAIKKLLSNTASKNTAVSCHWIRSRRRSELAWIVGNRCKFDAQGHVPVNSTRKTITNTQWENDWRYLPLIKSLAALAALFHDWGKASDFFQTKLRENRVIGDPLRHEWISTLFLKAYVGTEPDNQWLTRLASGEMDVEVIMQRMQENIRKPLGNLPSAASLLAWLIVSHHRLPVPKNVRDWIEEPASDLKTVLKRIARQWGYENCYDEEEYRKNLNRCFSYENGLPCQSSAWLKQAKKWAQRLHDCLLLIEQAMSDGSWRLVLHHARLSLMLGDHHYSSCGADSNWNSELALFANTDRQTQELKQKLDEHLVGVAQHALRIAHLLPALEGKNGELPRAFDVQALKKKSRGDFRWQETAVNRIINWRKSLPEKYSIEQVGFFAVNMASTGKGKTFANAKIIRSLSSDRESLRFILALGLRTLTLQTGDEYRQRIGLDDTQLAVLIGSRAVLELHNQRVLEKKRESDAGLGSESLEVLLDNEVCFETDIPEDMLSTVFANDAQREKNKKFLYAPVLSCTIDHLMAATETSRGGRYILPGLRLMSSDLVIDEIDDFDGKDLIAIGRLVHLAGMLGRKVMISSATISPDLAEGYFNAYQNGWSIYTKTRDASSLIGCAWIDEFTTRVEGIVAAGSPENAASFQYQHQAFISKRVSALKQQPVKRKADIVDCRGIKDGAEAGDEDNIQESWFEVIRRAVVQKHHDHHLVEAHSRRRVSFGVVRVANIPPCIALTRYLAGADWSNDHEIRVMAYHSQQVLLMRSAQEKHLDELLKRDTDNPQSIFENPVIRQHLQQCTTRNIIFILVATPVEEVGRDHDFDWAVIEPSSFRSIVQLAGRVLRHRNYPVENPNLALLQYNLKSLINDDRKPAFCRPGFESEAQRLSTHDLTSLLDTKALAKSVDAQPRIRKHKQLKPTENLVDLEHHCLHQLLSAYNQKGPESLQGWLTECWWLTGLPQRLVRFRESAGQLRVYLTLLDDVWCFVEKDARGNINPVDKLFDISQYSLNEKELGRMWLIRDYESILDDIAEAREMSLHRAGLLFGELSLPGYGSDPVGMSLSYCDQLGLSKGALQKS